jgi:parallel beta-helix repeat protein
MVLIGAVVATSSVGVVTATEQDADSDRFTLTGEDDDLLVWGGSLLTLRSDTSSAETTVPIHDVFYNETERNVVIEENRDNIAVYGSPQDVTIDFKTRSNADISKFDDNRNAQVILASFEQNEKTETVGGLDALNDVLQPGLDGNLTELRTQAAKRNVTFEINNSVGTNVGDGNFKYNLNETFDSVDSGDSGPYITMLALPRDNTDGFNVTDNPGDTDGEDLLTLPGNATLVGVETVAVHEEQSSFDAPNSIAAGDDFEVDPDSSLSGDVTQSVLVYREDTFLGEETTVKIDGQFSTGLNESDITLQHSIQDVNGVGNMTADGNLFGIKSQQRIVAGTTPLGDIVDRLSNESDTNVTRESVAPNTTIDASGTTVPDWNGGNVTVETYGNWTSGTYRVIHAAENGTVEGFETTTTTITVNGVAPPNFAISNLSVVDGVTEGENITVEYNVTNTGSLPDQQDVNLTVDGQRRDTTTLSIDAGNTSTVTREITTTRGDAGLRTIGVASEDDTRSVEASVLEGEAPNFDVSIRNINSTVIEGDSIVADYRIENTGDFSDSQSIQFFVNQSEESNTTKELNSSEVVRDSFEYTTDDGDSPELNITVASENTSDTFIVDVREPSELILNDDFTATPSEVTVGQGITFNGTVNNTGDIPNATRVDLRRNDTDTRLLSTNVSLSGDAEEEVEFDYITEGDDNVASNRNTTYNLTIEYNGTRVDTRQVEVNVTDADSDFNVNKTSFKDLDDGENASTGDTITVDATVNNTGGDGSTTVVLYANSDGADLGDSQGRVDQTPVMINNGSNQSVELSHILPASTEEKTVNYSVGVPTRDGARRENVSVDVNRSAEFRVTVNKAPSSITAGEDDIEINATIKNVGGEPATKSATLRLDGEVLLERSVQLDAGNSTTRNYTAPTRLQDAGQDLTLTFRTTDGSKTNTTDLNKPAAYEINSTTINNPVQGDDLNVTVSIDNTGDESATKPLTVSALGSGASNEANVQIDPGKTNTTSLNISTAALEAGEQSILITAGTDDSAIEQSTVLQPADISPEIDSITSPIRTGATDSLNVTATLSNDGEVDGTVNTTLSFGDDQDTQNNINVPAGGTTSIDLNISASSIGTGDDGNDAIVTVINGSANGDNTTAVENDISVVNTNEAIFRISDLTVDDRTNTEDVLRGSSADVFVNATVENVGDQSGTQTIELAEQGSAIDSRTDISLSDGSTTTVNFSVNQDDLTSGDRTLTVRSEDSSQSDVVTVRDQVPPTFEVTLEDDVSDLKRGDTVNVSVENTGDVGGSLSTTLTLEYDDQTVSETQTPAVAQGSSVEEAVHITVPDAPRAGEFEGELTASSPNTTETADVTVDFGTINDSLAAAAAGDTIDLASETFSDGPVTINKSVTLTGAAVLANTTTVDVTDPVTIDGVTWKGPETGLSVAEGADETTVRNTRFGPTVDYAIVTNADDIVIENNNFDQNTRAINLTDTTRSTIRDNQIIGTTQSAINSTKGIHTITDNNIEPEAVAINATDSPGFLNAENNWWGRPGGPIDGQEILSPVDFKPFSNSPNEAPDYRIEDSNITGVTEVVEGKTLEVNATINNTGGTAGDTQDTLTLELNGTQYDSLSFDETNFSAGNATADELELTVSSAQAASIDTGDITLSTQNDTFTQSDVKVSTAPEFEVSITDAPSDLESDQTLTVDAEVNNTGQATGSVTADLQFDGSQEDSTTTSVAGNGDTTLTLEYGLSDDDVGNAVPITVDVGDDTATATVNVTSAPSPPSDDDDGSSGGGGGGGVAEEEQTEAPTLEDVRADLEQTTPDTETDTDVVDNDPDSPGVQIETEGTESVQRISFDNEDASGRVNIKEYQSPPESVSQSVSAAVSNEDSSDETTTTESQVNVVTVADITPDSESARESPATVTLTVDSDQLDDPQNAVVVKEQENSWTTLETTVEETSAEEVTLEARTESFSLFAVAEVDGGDQPPAQTDDGQTEPADDGEPDEPEDDGGIGTGVIVGLILLVLIGVGVYIYQQQ